MISFFLILSLVASSVYGVPDKPFKVKTSSGILVGRESEVLGKKLRLFLGIPYAQPPIENLRFKKPQPLDSPEIERNVTDFGPSCMQPQHVASVISPLLNPNAAQFSEDCLFLNIYVPNRTNLNASLPVMVWLPGEGFDFADPHQYDGSFLAVKGQAIVVTVNYRLSAFGFLTTLSDDAPANNGLFDQRMALKWVKRNIANFGGNPQNVTLFGRFTGSMSAAIHTFSPLSLEENLFQTVILQSGFPDGDWAYNSTPLNLTFEVARAVDCYFPELTEIISCLKEKSAEVILKAAMGLKSRFRPTVDYELIYGNIIHAVRNSRYAPLPVMVGLNENEGTLCTTALKAMGSEYYDKFLNGTLSSSDFSSLVDFYMSDFFKVHSSAANRIVDFFYKNYETNQQQSLLRFCGDLFIYSRAETFSNELAKHKKTLYVYNFNHKASFSSQPSFVTSAHGDDVLFALALTFKVDDLPEGEVKLTERIVSGLVNFAKTGNPNPLKSYPVWPQYTAEDRLVLDFVVEGEASQIVHKTQHEKAAEFWTSVIPPVINGVCEMPPTTAGLSTHQNSETKNVVLPSSETKSNSSVFLFLCNVEGSDITTLSC
ncbi:Cholinesterase like protein [Argiope bruennichi]|uniref:Cholinesterase like protein n=1 Tax=Argiope bruennichi TaxID=94029 RepID=A0A8T0F2G4_ARGBR|nr:Cholinesterase like protein [Argiope bruennichi]